MDSNTGKRKKYFIIFERSKTKHWIYKFLNPYFQHVYLMYKSEGGHMWTIINPVVGRIDIENRFVCDFPHPRSYAGADTVIVPIMVRSKEENMSMRLGVLSCVEVIKGFLGIKSFLILTPYQLYRQIKEDCYGKQS